MMNTSTVFTIITIITAIPPLQRQLLRCLPLNTDVFQQERKEEIINYMWLILEKFIAWSFVSQKVDYIIIIELLYMYAHVVDIVKCWWTNKLCAHVNCEL